MLDGAVVSALRREEPAHVHSKADVGGVLACRGFPFFDGIGAISSRGICWEAEHRLALAHSIHDTMDGSSMPDGSLFATVSLTFT